MDKNEKAPNFVYPNNESPNNSPFGYPDMSQRDPKSWGKEMSKTAPMHIYEGPQSHSINPAKNQYASMSELQRMKLAK